MTDYKYADLVAFAKGSTRPPGKCLGFANNDVVQHFGTMGNYPNSAKQAADQLAAADQLHTDACPSYPHVDFYDYVTGGVNLGHVDWHFPQHGLHIADSSRTTVKLNASGTIGEYANWGPRRGWAAVPALGAKISFVNDPVVASSDLDTIAHQVINGAWGNGADRVARLTAAGYDAKAVQARVNYLLGQPTGKGPQVYTVQRGDNLSSIAAKFHVPGGWRALYAENESTIGHNPNIIRVGMTLNIPA